MNKSVNLTYWLSALLITYGACVLGAQTESIPPLDEFIALASQYAQRSQVKMDKPPSDRNIAILASSIMDLRQFAHVTGLKENKVTEIEANHRNTGQATKSYKLLRTHQNIRAFKLKGLLEALYQASLSEKSGISSSILVTVLPDIFNNTSPFWQRLSISQNRYAKYLMAEKGKIDSRFVYDALYNHSAGEDYQLLHLFLEVSRNSEIINPKDSKEFDNLINAYYAKTGLKVPLGELFFKLATTEQYTSLSLDYGGIWETLFPNKELPENQLDFPEDDDNLDHLDLYSGNEALSNNENCPACRQHSKTHVLNCGHAYCLDCIKAYQKLEDALCPFPSCNQKMIAK